MSLIPVEYKAIAILVAVAALAAGAWGILHHERTLGAAQAVADQNARALTASLANQAVSAQRVAAIQEVAHAADVQASAARADADAARSADQRLRARLAALSRAAADHPAASGAGPATPSADTVPADVFGRIDDAAGVAGEYADALRIHLDACIGAHGTLNAPARP